MKREEEIKKESKNRYPYIKGLPQTLANQEIFIESAKWADKTMIGKARDWLQCIDFEVEYFTTDSDGYTFFNADKFIEDFCKKMEE